MISASFARRDEELSADPTLIDRARTVESAAFVFDAYAQRINKTTIRPLMVDRVKFGVKNKAERVLNKVVISGRTN